MLENATPELPRPSLNGHPVRPANGHELQNGFPGINGASPSGAASPSATGTAPANHAGLAVRQAAQPHTPQPAVLGAAGENDPLPPPLDKEGLPKTRPIVYISPIPPSARALQDTARRRSLERLEEHFPVRAPELEADFDDGVQAGRERHLDLERLLWERLGCENTEIERRNLALEARRAQLEEERNAATKPDLDRLSELEIVLASANQAAAAAVSRAHGLFDPLRVEIEAIRDSMRLSLPALAGRLGLPFVPSDEGWGEDVARWTDLGSGALFGTSLGLLSGLFNIAALKSLHPGPMAMWLIAMLLGWVIAVEASRALAGDAARLSEARWTGLPAKGWASALVKTVVTTSVLCVIWTGVDGQGILKLASQQAALAGHGAASGFLTLATGAAASVPFLAFALARGARQGRLNGIRLRLLAVQEQDLRERAEVAVALDAVGRVCEVCRQGDALRASIARIEAPYEAEIALLASRVREPRFELDDEARQRLRRSSDEWAKAFATWKTALAQLVDEVEPLDGQRRTRAHGERASRNRQSLPGDGVRENLLHRITSWWRRLRG